MLRFQVAQDACAKNSCAAERGVTYNEKGVARVGLKLIYFYTSD